MRNFKKLLLIGMISAFIAALFASCSDKKAKVDGEGIGVPYGEENFGDVIKRRDLNADDILAAVKTYTPDKNADEYVALNSGGQRGNMIIYTVPSMRLVKYVPTNTKDPHNGYGYSVESYNLMKDGFIDDMPLMWGDTHHPGFSETNGLYNGKWATVNDKANPRIFIVSLKDWELKQIVQNPIFRNDHGGAFFTPNSEYIIEACQYPTPPDRKYYSLTEANFLKYWRGGITYWKFDNDGGRINEKESFTILAPPYTQDLSDAGKNASYGWSFTNSFCSEAYFGGIESGRPPFEAGCSSKDTDYLHVVNWRKAEELVKSGNYKIINGHKVMTIDMAAKLGVLYLIPEPKSPHGVDVDPTGDYIVVAGKLDSHAWVYSFEKIMKAIEEENFEDYDPYGLPIIALEDALHGSVEVGLGPLHNQYDDEKGIIYTSIYVDSKVTKWDYINLKVLDSVPSHYNIGHLVSAHGDTKEPHGKYLIALNKLSIDRFNPVGPLHPQNHQLIDIDANKMKVIYDLPIPMGEPHYTTLIHQDDFGSQETYPVGTDIQKMAKSEHSITAGNEKITNSGNKVEVFGTIQNGKVTPTNIEANQGQTVTIHLTNLGETKTDHYVYEVASYDAVYRWRPGETATIEFVAEKAGMYPLLLDKIHGPDGRALQGYLSVKFDKVADVRRLLAYSQRVEKDRQMQAYKPSAIELKNLLPGELEYLNGGCNACHRFGKDFNGPDLLNVHQRRDDVWLKDWIMNPEEKYGDDDIEALRQIYKLAMPDQNLSAEETDKVIVYMKKKSEKVAAESGK
ncbi:MAG: hypothetical protein B6244_03640 [Candidatus Cloacimonetes bacterium 4572_55]|nr:MAG: hypothetical protein B6244_03640 [Candidatus Cloacimonetes bacterium 4572_55]